MSYVTQSLLFANPIAWPTFHPHQFDHVDAVLLSLWIICFIVIIYFSTARLMKVRQKEKTSNRSPEKGDNPSEKAIKEREINELNVYIIFLASLMVILMCSLVYRLAKPELDEFPRSRPESPFEVEDKPFTK